MIRLLPPIRRLKFYFITCSLVLLIKAFWVPILVLSPSDLNSEAGREDILAQRRYLIERTVSPDFVPASAFRPLPAQFRGEWVIGTLSMTAAALLNTAILYPETSAPPHLI